MSDKDLACALFLYLPVVVTVLSIPVIFLFWGAWKDRTDTQVLFLPSFRKCNVLSNFATSEMKITPVCI